MRGNIVVEGHIGTWYQIASAIIQGKEYYLLEHEDYGDEVCYLHRAPPNIL